MIHYIPGIQYRRLVTFRLSIGWGINVTVAALLLQESSFQDLSPQDYV
jgi:hypothetical protein